MKRRKTKKLISRVERYVQQELRTLFCDPTSSEPRSGLNLGLVDLIQVTLRLNDADRAKYWWTDDLEWSEVSSRESQLEGRGRIWWGRRSDVAAAMVSTPFEAILSLNSSGRRLKYSVTFEDQGAKFVLRNENANQLSRSAGD
jgi:hypothetical protein